MFRAGSLDEFLQRTNISIGTPAASLTAICRDADEAGIVQMAI
jgi:hypothetical protein